MVKMKKIANYGLLSIFSLFVIVFLVSCVSGITKEKAGIPPGLQESPKKIICTTENLKTDYEILGIITQEQDYATFKIKDPLSGAIKKGMEEFEKKAVAAGADAVVGIRYSFSNRTESDQGRVLIYGTAVKFK